MLLTSIICSVILWTSLLQSRQKERKTEIEEGNDFFLLSLSFLLGTLFLIDQNMLFYHPAVSKLGHGIVLDKHIAVSNKTVIWVIERRKKKWVLSSISIC